MFASQPGGENISGKWKSDSGANTPAAPDPAALWHDAYGIIKFKPGLCRVGLTRYDSHTLTRQHASCLPPIVEVAQDVDVDAFRK